MNIPYPPISYRKLSDWWSQPAQPNEKGDGQ